MDSFIFEGLVGNDACVHIWHTSSEQLIMQPIEALCRGPIMCAYQDLVWDVTRVRGRSAHHRSDLLVCT